MKDGRLLRALGWTLGLALVGSCQYGVADLPAVPESPTYNRDVRLLLGDHCFVCHASPPSRDAPSYFRLDVYDDAGSTLGAKTMASLILADVESGKMPPAAKNGDGVSPNGIELLRRWVDQGTPP